MTSKPSEAKLFSYAPISPTKLRPNMPFLLELDRKLKTCGKPGCKEATGCEEGCSFTSSYVNLQKPIKLPSSTLLPFSYLVKRDFGAIRLSTESRKVLLQYLSWQMAKDTKMAQTLPTKSVKDEKTKPEANRKTAAPAPQDASSKYKQPMVEDSSGDSSSEEHSAGTQRHGMRSTSTRTRRLREASKREIEKPSKSPEEGILSKQAANPSTNTYPSPPMSEPNPPKTASITFEELRKMRSALESENQRTVRDLEENQLSERMKISAEHEKKLQDFKEVAAKKKEELTIRINAAAKEEATAKVDRISKEMYELEVLESATPGSIQSDILSRIDNLFSRFRNLWRWYEGAEE